MTQLKQGKRIRCVASLRDFNNQISSHWPPEEKCQCGNAAPAPYVHALFQFSALTRAHAR